MHADDSLLLQGILEKALCLVQQETRSVLSMYASGRTDSGVHARGQVGPVTCICLLWKCLKRVLAAIQA